MLLSSTLTPTTLAAWSRALHHGLDAGLSAARVFGLQSTKGPAEGRALAADIALSLQKGETLEDAMTTHSNRLPGLFLQMAIVGEQSGRMVDVFHELEEYYTLQWSLRKQFRSQITLPVMQFVLGVLIIAGLIWILGEIAETRGGAPIAPIGFGLVGGKGAIKFLLFVVGTIVGVYVAYRILTRTLRQRAAVEGFLLKIPSVGPCIEAFAMNRLCTALQLTMDSNMSTDEAVGQSLRASGNGAYMATEPLIVATVKAGNDLASGFKRCPVFPSDFAPILEVAEISGQIPESMAKQAAYYREEARRRIKTLTQMASFGVWAIIAIGMIWAILSIAGVYLSAVNQAAG
jgi:type II secretory pathway component PulF